MPRSSARRATERVITRRAALPRGARSSGACPSPRLLDSSPAEREATRDKAASVGVEHLLHALAQEIRGPAGEILSSFGISPGAFRAHLAALQEGSPSGTSLGGNGASVTTSGGSGSSSFTRDLVADARQGKFDPVIGRDVEVRRLMQS